MWLESTTPRDQSIRLAAFRWRRSSRCNLSHTPARCHSLSRRQAVTPEQPICRGTIRHGTPLTSTNTIAVNAVRSPTLGRPVRCGVRSGNNGSTRPHSPSSTSSGLALGHLLVLLVRKYFVRSHLGEQQASGSSPL